MTDIFYIMTILEVSALIPIILIAFGYSLLILSIQRFRTYNNIFIVNICFAMIGTSVYEIVYVLMLYFDLASILASQTCGIVYYIYNFVSVEITFTFVVLSFHRLCSIIYHTRQLFKTKKWIAICITCQWAIVFIIPLPFLSRKVTYCVNDLWTAIYTYMMVIFVPLLLNTIINLRIMIYIRSSTNRVQTQNPSRDFRIETDVLHVYGIHDRMVSYSHSAHPHD
ncbi:hypothetical protein I4U23_015465 [Adineta vaga]|nr:hypothetical protein I4U23_015465 [Adineta vaga]